MSEFGRNFDRAQRAWDNREPEDYALPKKECPTCGGFGKVDQETCPTCNGDGEVEVTTKEIEDARTERALRAAGI